MADKKTLPPECAPLLAALYEMLDYDIGAPARRIALRALREVGAED